MISGTRFFAECLKIPPQGDRTATEPCRCVLCGGEIAKGELISTFKPQSSFVDWNSLQFNSGTQQCGYCKAVAIPKFMTISMKGIVTHEGFFPFGGNDAIAYWLRNPPTTPYMAFINNAQMAHVLWKTPVSTSPDMFYVRLDDQNFRLRLRHVIKGAEAYTTIKDSAMALYDQTSKEERGRYYFDPITTDRDMEATTHGQFSWKSLAYLEAKPELASAYHTLKQLTAGELWAMRNLITAKKTVRPEIKILPGQAL